LFEDCDDEETPDVSDGIGLAEALLGLPGFRVLEASEARDELVVAVETVITVAWCASCGVRAESQDRMPIEIRKHARSLAGRHVWCGASAGGGVSSRRVTRRRGRSTPSMSTRRR
jgi:hypothetical protein